MNVVYYGDPILRTKTKKVESFDQVRSIVEQMKEVMYSSDGVGLASTQVGLDLSLFLMDDGSDKGFRVVINPEILFQSQEEDIFEEGCLSFPGIYGDVSRPLKIRVRYHDLDANVVEEDLENYTARIFQHEFDHTNGVLFVDRFSSVKKRMVQKDLKELVRQYKEMENEERDE